MLESLGSGVPLLGNYPKKNNHKIVTKNYVNVEKSFSHNNENLEDTSYQFLSLSSIFTLLCLALCYCN